VTRQTIGLIGLAAVLAGCAGQDTRRPAAKDAADQMSRLSADPKQAELWRQAAARSSGNLEQVPVAARPVQLRDRATGASQPTQPKAVTLPPGMPNALRIVNVPELPRGAFAGSARITRVEGERVELDLGENRVLSLLVRSQSSPLRAKAGDSAQLELRLRTDPHDRAEVVALRGPARDGIVSVLESGPKPVTVRVALFSLTATQVGNPARGSMDVQVTAGDERQVLSQGRVAEFKRAGLSVGVVASLAVTGEDVNREEGQPYSLRLLAWPTQQGR
jgi:hypothetical protein